MATKTKAEAVGRRVMVASAARPCEPPVSHRQSSSEISGFFTASAAHYLGGD